MLLFRGEVKKTTILDDKNSLRLTRKRKGNVLREEFELLMRKKPQRSTFEIGRMELCSKTKNGKENDDS